MNLLWPGSLLLLALLPLLLGAYIWMLRRRRRYTLRYSSLSLLREALPKRTGLRRHLPFALFLLGISSLVLAVGRPVVNTIVPAGQATIILAVDVSRSMRQRDIDPSRIQAAQAAAYSYIDRQHPNTRIGIVAFAGFAELIQPPTNDQAALKLAIDSLTLGRRTAIGSGILESVDAIAEVNDLVPSIDSEPASGHGISLAAGEFLPDIIVLLTDGASNSGPLPLDAAQQAVDRGIRVYTIGFGTAAGDSSFGGPSPGSGDPYSGGEPQYGGWFRRGLDEETLKEVAAMTGGKYYSATSASELQAVFENLPTYLITKNELVEISFIFAALGAVLAAAASVLSLAWNPLP